MKKAKYQMNLDSVRDFLNAERYSMQDFWLCCNFSEQEILCKTRKKEILAERQVGIVWAVLGGCKLYEAGLMFGKDRCNVLHSINHILKVIAYPKMYGEQYDLLLKIVRTSSLPYQISEFGEINMLRLMDYTISPVLS